MSFISETRGKPEIPLLVVGFDFRIASSALREKLVTTEEDRAYLFDNIKKADDSAGILVLETCNRLEWLISTQYPGWIAEILKAWMLSKWQEAYPDISNFPSPYVFEGEDAVFHVLRVVVGMESLAVGEAQIAGQFQSSLIRSQQEKTSSPIINRLSHIAGRIARSGYRIGFRSNYRQGIHGLVVKYLEQYSGKMDLDRKTILVAGMGEIGRRTAALIEESFGCRVQPVNRTVKPEHDGKWASMYDLKSLSAEADVLVVATGSPIPLLDPDRVELSPQKRHEPLLIMDIGIPRQVTEKVQQHPMVLYRNIDHLIELGHETKNHDDLALVESEIKKEFHRFKQFCRGRELSDLLSSVHSGRLELTENRIPDFVETHLSDLDQKRRKKIEKEIKKFIKDYSNEIFFAFHDTMEKYWSAQTNGY